jgi:hypothetical protein
MVRSAGQPADLTAFIALLDPQDDGGPDRRRAACFARHVETSFIEPPYPGQAP